jgi:uncharacterized phiE125 gp8 family phage protein
MILERVTDPIIEPITLAEAKEHIRINNGSFADFLTSSNSIKPDTYAIGTTNGTGVLVVNSYSMVNINVGTTVTSLTCTIQESDDNTNYTDWYTFPVIIAGSQLLEKQYTGIKKYIRVKAVIAGSDAMFDAVILEGQPITIEDTQIEQWITTAREYVEEYQNRALITQTWDLWLDEFPCRSYIEIPRSPLQTVAHIKYYDEDNVAHTFNASLYTVDANTQKGRVFLNAGEIWDNDSLRPFKAVNIQFTAGYGDDASDVPEIERNAIRLMVGHFYENRENANTDRLYTIPDGARALSNFRREILL